MIGVNISGDRNVWRGDTLMNLSPVHRKSDFCVRRGLSSKDAGTERLMLWVFEHQKGFTTTSWSGTAETLYMHLRQKR